MVDQSTALWNYNQNVSLVHYYVTWSCAKYLWSLIYEICTNRLVECLSVERVKVESLLLGDHNGLAVSLLVKIGGENYGITQRRASAFT